MEVIMFTWFIYGIMTVFLCSICKFALSGIRFNNKYSLVVNFKDRGYIFSFLVLVLSFFSAFRKVTPYQGGTDAYSYVYDFLNSSYNDILYRGFFDNLIELRITEPLFMLLTIFVRSLTDNYHLYFLVCYTIIAYSICKYIFHYYNSQSCFVSLVLAFSFILYSFNILRGSLAVSLCLLGFVFFDKKKWLKGLLLIISASLIHYTALCCLLIFILWYSFEKDIIKFERKDLIFIIVSINLFFIIMSDSISNYMLSTKYALYFSSEYDMSILGRIHDWFFGLFLIYIYPYVKNRNLARSIILLSLYYGLTYFIVYLMGWRISDYFLFIKIYVFSLLPSEVYRLFNSKDLRIYYIFTLLLYSYILMCYFQYMYQMYRTSGIFPYSFTLYY